VDGEREEEEVEEVRPTSNQTERTTNHQNSTMARDLPATGHITCDLKPCAIQVQDVHPCTATLVGY